MKQRATLTAVEFIKLLHGRYQKMYSKPVEFTGAAIYIKDPITGRGNWVNLDQVHLFIDMEVIEGGEEVIYSSLPSEQAESNADRHMQPIRSEAELSESQASSGSGSGSGSGNGNGNKGGEVQKRGKSQGQVQGGGSPGSLT